MPIGVGAGAAIAGLAAGGGAVTAGILNSGAAKDAASLQTQAADHAADVQAQSAANTLAFQQQQAQQARVDANTAAQANYNQWAAKEGRLSTLGQQIGMQPFQVPAYVPLSGLNGPSASAPTQASPSAAPTSANPNITTMGAAMNQSNAASPSAAPSASQAGVVTLRNQYGQIKQVPNGQASVWQGLGYQVVG